MKIDSRIEIDKRIIKIIARLKKTGTIRFTNDFTEAVGMSKQSFQGVKIGRQHFTVSHIQKMRKIYNVNLEYVFGFDKKNMLL